MPSDEKLKPVVLQAALVGALGDVLEAARESPETRLTHLRALGRGRGLGLGPPGFRPGLYESPIEELFAYEFLRHAPASALLPQRSLRTRWGVFRPDFVMNSAGRCVAVECDGEAFHEAEPDRWRDALLLGSEVVDVIYRLEGKAIHWNLHDCLYILAVLEPAVFHERGRLSLERLASFTLKNRNLHDDVDEDESLSSTSAWGVGAPLEFVDEDEEARLDRDWGSVGRRTRASIRPGGAHGFRWDFSREHPGLRVEELIQKWDDLSFRERARYYRDDERASVS